MKPQLLRYGVVLVVLAAASLLGASMAQASAADVVPSDSRRAVAGSASGASSTLAAKGFRFRKQFFVPVAPAPSLMLARVVITLKKPASPAGSSSKSTLRPRKPVVSVGGKTVLPQGAGVIGSIWRTSQRNRFVAAAAIMSRPGKGRNARFRAFFDVRASRPIRSVNWSFARFRTSDLAVEDFGSCLFTTSERKSARRFSKRLGGNLPSRFGPKTVVGSMTAANCGPIGSRLLEVTGFTQRPGGSSGGANDGSGNGDGGANDDGSSGGGNGGADGSSGGGDSAGGGSPPDGDGGQPPTDDLVPCEGIGASTGAPTEHIVVLTCDEDWTALTLPKFKGNPWTEASTLDGGGTCSINNGNVACTFDAQPGQALLLTSTKAVAVGSSVTSRVGGFPGARAQNVPVVFESD